MKIIFSSIGNISQSILSTHSLSELLDLIKAKSQMNFQSNLQESQTNHRPATDQTQQGKENQECRPENVCIGG